MVEACMTWADFADTHADREWEGWAEFYSAINAAGLSDTERQAAYRDYRAAYTAQVRGKSLDGWWNSRRKGVKGERRAYTDASTATEETAT
jgi:hypothetical protein